MGVWRAPEAHLFGLGRNGSGGRSGLLARVSAVGVGWRRCSPCGVAKLRCAHHDSKDATERHPAPPSSCASRPRRRGASRGHTRRPDLADRRHGTGGTDGTTQRRVVLTKREASGRRRGAGRRRGRAAPDGRTLALAKRGRSVDDEADRDAPDAAGRADPEVRHAMAGKEAADEAVVDAELDPAPDTGNPVRDLRASAADAYAARRALTTTRRGDAVDPRGARIAR